MATEFPTTMNQLGPIPRKRLIDGLKIILSAVVLVAIGFGLLRRVNPTFLPIALDFATAAAIGLTVGWTTRWSLKGRAGLLHLLVAVAITIAGLIILGLITSGQAGLQMLVSRREVDWNGLGQVLIGSASALLALRAWRRPIQISPTPSPSAERVVPRTAPPPTASPRRRRRNGRASQLSRSIVSRTRRAGRIVSLSRMARIIAVPRWKVPHITMPHVDFRNLFHGSDSGIKVRGVTEERCPYCLDVIHRNDPRGVRVCSICHTAHHADCWAVTGMCQIPHHHA